MSSCSCDLVDPTTTSATSATTGTTATLCKTCGKRIDAGRAGSFTQWIFRSDKCDCEVPEPTEVNVAPVSFETEDAKNDYVESEIELDPSVFPTDRYKALREIGQGAAGQVFLCRDKLLKTKVALKCLRHLSPEQLISFQEEARATSKLSHPNIVKVLNFGITDGGAPYMVMDFIDGISLEKYLARSGPLAAADAMSIVAQTADALSYAHSKGVLHRDIKSSNILIEGDRACLIDFGIAMVKQAHQEPTIVQGRTVVGTPAYMPPDQANGRIYDERSEIYSLGCVLFEALAGETPFSGDTALEIINKHATHEPPKVSDINPDSDCTEEVESILARCLAKHQDDRFGAMDELRDACGAGETHASAEGDTEENGVENKNAFSASTFAPESKAKDRKVVVVVIATILFLMVAGTWIVMSQRELAPLRQQRLSDDTASLAIDETSGERSNAIRRMIKRGDTSFKIGVLWPDCTDKDLAVFNHTNTATRVDLTDLEISDAALKHFADSPLEMLVLSGTNVKTLEFIPDATTLEILHLANTRIDDAALLRLSGFRQLHTIMLNGTNVTSDGIIKALSNLPIDYLYVNRCPKISSAGEIERLRVAFPFARIDQRKSLISDSQVVASRFFELGQNQRSIDLWKKWYDYSKSHADPRRRLAVTSLCGMAANVDRMHKAKLAKEYLDKALAISHDSKFIGNIRATQEAFFEHYILLKDIDAAIPAGMKALDLSQQQGGSIDMSLGSRVAECLMIKDRYEEALGALAKTEQDRFNWFHTVKTDPTIKVDLKLVKVGLIYHQIKMAHCLIALKRGEEALAKSNKALLVFFDNSVVIKDSVLIADVYLMKARAELECKKFQNALESNESAIESSKDSKASRGKVQYKFALKQKQAILKAQKESGITQ